MAGFEPTTSSLPRMRSTTRATSANYGTPAPIRTERTAPFERADFTNLSTGAYVMAYPEGFEPPPAVLETVMLPLTPGIHCMEHRVRFELTAFRICNPVHWASLAPVHCLAESIGFEPMRHFRNDSLANCCLNHSANSPLNHLIYVLPFGNLWYYTLIVVHLYTDKPTLNYCNIITTLIVVYSFGFYSQSVAVVPT